MKKSNKIIFSIVFSFLLLFSNYHYNKIEVFAAQNSSEIVMELNSKRVLHAINENEKKFMASTTKILTAIVIIENCDLEEEIIISDKTVGIEGSSIYLEAGEKLKIKHLLYGLMLRSGNDCAETLAVHCSGSIGEFANLMNATAKKIGAVNSNFVNPHGLHDENHYTTAYDLALISCYAMKNKDFRNIVSTKAITIPFTTREYNRRLINKNKMLNEFEGSTGIKTGYTKKAGRCLVSSCMRNGMELICVVLNCPPMFEQSKTLLNTAFGNYRNYKIIESDNIIDFISVDGENEKCAIGINEDIVLPLTEIEFESLKIEYNYPKKLDKPIKKGQEVGNLKIYCQNNLIFTQKIYTIISVD